MKTIVNGGYWVSGNLRKMNSEKIEEGDRIWDGWNKSRKIHIDRLERLLNFNTRSPFLIQDIQ